MNIKVKKVLDNISYAFSANFITMLISIVLTLIVPKALGIVQYSYWQLYIFYVSFVGFFHFGWLDGIYLTEGGKHYSDLKKKELGTQFWYLLIFESCISSGLVLIFLYLINNDTNKQFVLIATCLSGIIIILKAFVLNILQVTNRIKEYAKFTRLDRVIYFISVILYLLFGGRNYKALILADIISRGITLIYSSSKISDLIFIRLDSITKNLKLIFTNVRIGMNLMIANIASQLVVGTVRLGIERGWDIKTFGKISFTLSIANMILTFINAIGAVMFPMLRRTDDSNRKKIYVLIRNLVVPLTYIILLAYYPAKILLLKWLPAYQESFLYMGILFPMFIYEGRMSLLINTYLKTYRKEKSILYINLLTLILGVVGTGIFVVYLNNLIFSVILILVLIMFKCIVSEVYLSRFLNIEMTEKIFQETILTIIFVASNLFLSSEIAVLVFAVCLFIYLFIIRNTIIQTIKELKNILIEK